mmetsp:Transcript_21167/g.54192  ORF Transcript_21167/g.54192 Transcript_21167/m.54192 type:complete len:269 (+) Transcript_21167:953-1759(+)
MRVRACRTARLGPRGGRELLLERDETAELVLELCGKRRGVYRSGHGGRAPLRPRLAHARAMLQLLREHPRLNVFLQSLVLVRSRCTHAHGIAAKGGRARTRADAEGRAVAALEIGDAHLGRGSGLLGRRRRTAARQRRRRHPRAAASILGHHLHAPALKHGRAPHSAEEGRRLLNEHGRRELLRDGLDDAADADLLFGQLVVLRERRCVQVAQQQRRKEDGEDDVEEEEERVSNNQGDQDEFVGDGGVAVESAGECDEERQTRHRHSQ